MPLPRPRPKALSDDPKTGEGIMGGTPIAFGEIPPMATPPSRPRPRKNMQPTTQISMFGPSGSATATLQPMAGSYQSDHPKPRNRCAENCASSLNHQTHKLDPTHMSAALRHVGCPSVNGASSNNPADAPAGHASNTSVHIHHDNQRIPFRSMLKQERFHDARQSNRQDPAPRAPTQSAHQQPSGQWLSPLNQFQFVQILCQPTLWHLHGKQP